MFGFFKRRKTPPPTVSPEEQAAYEKGRNVASQYMGEMMSYVDLRAAQIERNYLEVFQGTLDRAREQVDHSPLLLARVEYDVFRENVDTAIDKLVDETKATLSEWDELHEMLGNSNEVDTAIYTYVSDRIGTLKITALERMMQYVDRLKEADDEWRRNHPELAAQEPLGD